MQFTQPDPPRYYQHVPCPNLFNHPLSMSKNLFHSTLFDNPNPNTHGRSWPGFPTSHTNFGDANCMEQLLVHCANALESNDATLAQQILWVLNNIASSDGDSNQRLTCGFLRALISRAAKIGTPKMLRAVSDTAGDQTFVTLHSQPLPAVELAGFLDLTPWHRFGFAAANAAILEAVEGFSVIHIIDLGVSHCMQIPTLIDSLSNRPDGPPFVKLTVAGAGAAGANMPPVIDMSYEELGSRLVNFARSRNVGMVFEVVPSSAQDGFDALIQQLRTQRLVFNDGEALVVNCHMLLHCISDETVGEISNSNSNSNSNPHHNLCSSSSPSLRDDFLRSVRSLEPTIVTLVDEDADFTSRDLVERITSGFNYLWIPFDAIDTCLPKGSKQRQQYEADVSWKIENLVASEGVERVERLEPKTKWVQRMKNSNFQGLPFSEEAVSEVKAMLDEHAAGWGLKKEDGDLVLTWKGHNAVFATAWAPA